MANDPTDPKITIPTDQAKSKQENLPKVSLENNSLNPTVTVESHASSPKVSIPVSDPATTMKAKPTSPEEEDDKKRMSKMANVEMPIGFRETMEAFFRKLVNGFQLAIGGALIAVGKLIGGKLGGGMGNMGIHLVESTPVMQETRNRFVDIKTPKVDKKNSVANNAQVTNPKTANLQQEQEASMTPAFDTTKEMTVKKNIESAKSNLENSQAPKTPKPK